MPFYFINDIIAILVKHLNILLLYPQTERHISLVTDAFFGLNATTPCKCVGIDVLPSLDIDLSQLNFFYEI